MAKPAKKSATRPKGRPAGSPAKGAVRPLDPTERFRGRVALGLQSIEALVRVVKYVVVGGVVIAGGYAYRPSIEALAGETTVVNANIAITLSLGTGAWGLNERRRRRKQAKEVIKLDERAGRLSSTVKVLQDRLRQAGADSDIPEDLRENQ